MAERGVDHAIVVKGVRVDATKVTAELLADPLVREAAVTAVDGRLVAYAAPERSADVSEARAAAVDSWRAVFDETYGSIGDDLTPAAATTGWNDSFTGKPIAPAQMAEWVDTTVARIAALAPKRVLEIGAGTGLLVRPLVSSGTIDTYVATDFSASAITVLDQLADELRHAGATTKLVVAEADAVDATRVADGEYDVVVLNSVVQYFPSLHYLTEALDAALAVVRPGGHVVLGDLRNEAVADAFFALKHELRSEADDVREAIRHDRNHDGELSVDPAWLAAAPARAPRVTRVEIAPRRGESTTEMPLFRYDAVLHVDCADTPERVVPEPGADLQLSALERRLLAGSEPFGYRAVRNGRLDEALAARDRHGFTPAGRAAGTGPGVDPEVLWRLAERHGWLARVSWADGDPDGAFDVTLLPPALAAATHFRFADPVSAEPVVAEVYPPGVAAVFTDRVRGGLAQRLPAVLVPVDVVWVTDLPRSGGVVDVTALPRPRADATAVRAESENAEASALDVIREVFAKRLGKPCGPDDNFFALGGESFTAAMCVRDLRQRGVTLSIRDLFEHRTPRVLAEHLS
ncbi:SAM-dependent methyltransferase [Saccharothrix ecbatanensis]|uniref:SAM-dependent methyltransferase n=1 Tax=Saccharothrix ecbatanensis TaxID=1105145 RepID=A0A7W9HN84_9PSEU|nr:class I SAM-dependent methyltransferase [Saccharothrix ecbatanensis]MBB5804998.1 SAM-dependent methyltransferase [Saccharothrix ecbatanensis]